MALSENRRQRKRSCKRMLSTENGIVPAEKVSPARLCETTSRETKWARTQKTRLYVHKQITYGYTSGTLLRGLKSGQRVARGFSFDVRVSRMSLRFVIDCNSYEWRPSLYFFRFSLRRSGFSKNLQPETPFILSLPMPSSFISVTIWRNNFAKSREFELRKRLLGYLAHVCILKRLISNGDRDVIDVQFNIYLRLITLRYGKGIFVKATSSARQLKGNAMFLGARKICIA